MSILKKLLLIATLSLSLTMVAGEKNVSAINDNTLRQAFDSLEANIAKREQFINTRASVIETLKRHATADESEKYGAIARAYENFNNDSTLYYYKLAAQSADDYSCRAVFEARRASLLPLAGFVSEAINTYDNIAVDSLALDAKIEYYKSGHRMCDLIATFYNDYPEASKPWLERAKQCNIELLRLVDDDHNSPVYKLTRGQILYESGEYAKAKTMLREVFLSQPSAKDFKSRAQVLLSRIANKEGDKNAELYYLVNSVNDLMTSGSLEIKSLFNLGMAIYDTGDVELAYKYLSMALADADKSHEWMRMLPIARSMSIIQTAHDHQVDNWNRNFTITVIILVIVIIILAFTAYRQHFNVERAKSKYKHLEDSNIEKEGYINQFISMCAVYMDKLTEFSSLVSRKIAAGKTADITRLLNSSKFLETQSAEFYEIFDNAMLSMYPNFLTEVNKLMKPEFQIVLKEDEKMNTDLRLLALMRLGVDDSTKIARILNYSLNTIYTYRNKLKSHARNRETFEDDILKISR